MSNKAIKHIKKKFLYQVDLPDEALDVMDKSEMLIPASQMTGLKLRRDQDCILITEKNIGIRAFHIKINGLNYFIPEPDPVLVYFNDAYNNYVQIKEERKKLLGVLNQSNLTEDISKVIYSFFGFTNGYVIFLFTAIEAFINRYIPEKFEYRIVRNNRTELYNRDQIQRHLTFDDKLFKVLYEISGKSFKSSFPIKSQHIQNLKEFRDLIVHTKGNLSSSTPYDYIYKKALNFNYEDTLLATRDLLNFYQSDCVENCPCSEDW